MSITSLVALKRGAATASATGMPQSSTLSSTCRIATPIQAPPGALTVKTGLLSSKTMVGVMEEKRRLPGAIEPARPGRGSYQFIAPFSMKPRPGGITPDGVPLVWVSETTMPSASMQETVVVFLASALTRESGVFSPLLIRVADSSA
jgi:hypothetical protein